MSLVPNKLIMDCKFCSNVSYNNLVGVIPSSKNFSRFSPDRLGYLQLNLAIVATIFSTQRSFLSACFLGFEWCNLSFAVLLEILVFVSIGWIRLVLGLTLQSEVSWTFQQECPVAPSHLCLVVSFYTLSTQQSLPSPPKDLSLVIFGCYAWENMFKRPGIVGVLRWEWHSLDWMSYLSLSCWCWTC